MDTETCQQPGSRGGQNFRQAAEFLEKMADEGFHFTVWHGPYQDELEQFFIRQRFPVALQQTGP